jgi:hypothetical protein
LNYALRVGATCGDDETFVAIPATSTDEHWEMATSSQYADGDNITTGRLTALGTFATGTAIEDPSNQTAALTVGNGKYTELEFAIQATAGAVDEGTYCFQVTNATSSSNFIYTTYPQITLGVGGGRIWTSGFELQSVTSGVEIHAALLTNATISTSIKRGGDASYRINSLVSGSAQGFRHEFKSVSGDGPFWLRAYLRIATLPSSENRIISFSTNRAYLTLNNSGQLQLYDEDSAGTPIGSASNALSLDTWYRIELKMDATGAGSNDTVEARIDGTNFATSNIRNLSTGAMEIRLGGNLNDESQTTGDWYFDDVAINENVGSSNNNYPGSGTIVMANGPIEPHSIIKTA